MAEYIAWVKGLTKRREVLAMAEILSMDRRFVAACCMEMWEWVDAEGRTDEALHRHVTGVTLVMLRSIVDVTGFVDAMLQVGWIRKGPDEGHWIFPKLAQFTASCSDERTSNAVRQARWREKHRNNVTKSVTSSVTEVTQNNGTEERRGEESIGEVSPITPLGENKKSTRKVFQRPTLEEVRDYCRERDNGVSPEQFMDHYDTCGWVQGKGAKPVKDWKACVRTWEPNNPKAAAAESRIVNAELYRTYGPNGPDGTWLQEVR